MWRGIPSFVGIEATSTASIHVSAMLDVQVRNFQISKKSIIYSNPIIAPTTAIPKKISIGNGLVGVGAARRRERT